MSTGANHRQNDTSQNGENSDEMKQLESKIDSCMSKLIQLQKYMAINAKIITSDLNEIKTSYGRLKKQKCSCDSSDANDSVIETNHVNINGPSCDKFPGTSALASPGSSNHASNNVDFKNLTTHEWKWREEDTVINTYFPQIGDSVVFCRKIHLDYCGIVQKNQFYPLDTKKDQTMMPIDGEEYDIQYDVFVRVRNIKYDPMIRGLCEIKLEYLKDDGSATNTGFTIRYHKSAIHTNTNFLVLRQIYDDAIGKWKPGDKCRMPIEGKWYFGKVLRVRQYLKNEELVVKMDGTEGEFMVRPWAIEPVDETRLPKSLGETIPILPSDIKPFHYKSQPDDWPLGVGSPNEILQRLEELENDYGHIYIYFRLYGDSLYTASVAYPIDLKIIKSRLESGFYRRFKALRLDVDYLMKNIIDIRSKNIHPSKCSKEKYDEFFKSNAPFHKIIIESDHNIKDLFAKLSLGVEESQENSSQNKPLIESHVSFKSESSAIKDNRRNKNLPDWANDCLRLLDGMLGCVGSVADYSSDDIQHAFREVIKLKLHLIQMNSSTLKNFLHDVENSLNQMNIRDKLAEELKIFYGNGKTEIFSKYVNVFNDSNSSKTNASLSTNQTRHTNIDHDSSTPQEKSKPNENSNMTDSPTSKIKRTNDSGLSLLEFTSPHKKLKSIESNDKADKSSANGTNNNEINDLRQASTSKASPKVTNSNSNKDSKDSNLAKNVELKRCDSNIQVSNKAQIKLTEMPKKPVKDEPKIPTFTPKEYLQAITPYQTISNAIVGKVVEVDLHANRLNNLSTFWLECSEKSRIKIDLWRNERTQFLKKIKLDQILSIRNLYVGYNTKYTKGDVHYDIIVKPSTTIHWWTTAHTWENLK